MKRRFLLIAAFAAVLVSCGTAQSVVRLAFIWASENIATNTPDPYRDRIPVFADLLHDGDDKVRMEAPEIFRVLGKLYGIVRIHYLGAIKAATGEKKQSIV